MSGDLRKKLVERATYTIVRLLEEFDVLFVIPPGSSRIEAVHEACKLLNNKGIPVEVVTYREPGSTVEEDVKYFENKLAEILKKRTKIKLIVVPRDTTTAIMIARDLKKAGLIECNRVCFLNIAEVYNEVYSKELGKIESHLVLDYNHIKKELENLEFKLEPGYSGISLTLIGRGDAKTCNLIRSLGPNRTRGVLDIIKEIIGKAPRKTMQRLIPDLLSSIIFFVENILAPEAAFAIGVSRSIIPIVRTLIGSRREDFKDLIVEFLVKSREIAPYVDQEVYEGVLDSIASHWGLTLNEFKTIIKNLAKIADREIVTVEDVEHIKNIVEGKLRTFEERVEKIEEEISKLESHLNVMYALLKIYKDVKDVPYIDIEDNEFYIKMGTNRYELATTKTYEDLSYEVEERLLNEGLVIVEGSSGIGKSTLVYYIITRLLLMSKEGLIKCRVLLISAPISEEEIVNLGEKIWTLIELMRKIGERLIIVYDPIPPKVYTSTMSTEAKVRGTLERHVGLNLEKLSEIYQEHRNVVSVLVVLPTRLFECARNYLRKHRKEFINLLTTHTIHFDERIKEELHEFVKRVLTVYSGCQDVDDLAKSICSKFRRSHTLIAKQAGLLLKTTNCQPGDIEKLIKEAKRSSKAFIKLIIKSRLGLLVQADSVEKDLLAKYASILAIRIPFVKVVEFGDYITTPALMSHLMKLAGIPSDKIESNHDWLSIRNEDLVEEALKELLVNAKFEPHQSIIDAIFFIIGWWGDKLWNMIQNCIDSPACLTMFLYMVGSTPFVIYKFDTLYNEFIRLFSSVESTNASKKCDKLYRLMIVDGKLPLLNGLLLIEFFLIGSPELKMKNKEVDLCSRVRGVMELYGGLIEKPTSLGSAIALGPYGLGLSLASLDNVECQEDAFRLLYNLLVLYERIILPAFAEPLIRGIYVKFGLFKHGEVHYLPPLIRMYVRVGDLNNAQGMVDYLIIHVDKLEPWMMVFLVEALCELSFKAPRIGRVGLNIAKAARLSKKVMSHDVQLGLLCEIFNKMSIAHMLIKDNKDNLAEEHISLAEQYIENLEKFADQGKLTNGLIKFLSYNSFVLHRPKEYLKLWLSVLKDKLVPLKATLYVRRALAEGRPEFIRKAEEAYSYLARKYAGTCYGYSYELARLTIGVLLDGINYELLTKLENLWNKVKETICYPEESAALSSLITTKAILGSSIDEHLIDYGEFLRSWRPMEWLFARLTLKALGIRQDLNFTRVMSTIKSHIDPRIRHLFLLERGLRTKDYDLVCRTLIRYRNELSNIIDSVVFNEVMSAGKKGCKDVIKELVDRLYEPLRKLEDEKVKELLRSYNDLVNVLEPHYVFELDAPSNTIASIALLLNALAERDFKLAKAHALRSYIVYPSFRYLFGELYKVLDESERAGKLTEEAKRWLAKVVLLHLM